MRQRNPSNLPKFMEDMFDSLEEYLDGPPGARDYIYSNEDGSKAIMREYNIIINMSSERGFGGYLSDEFRNQSEVTATDLVEISTAAAEYKLPVSKIKRLCQNNTLLCFEADVGLLVDRISLDDYQAYVDHLNSTHLSTKIANKKYKISESRLRRLYHSNEIKGAIFEGKLYFEELSIQRFIHRNS